MPTETDPVSHDRRRFRRFAVVLDLRYQVGSGPAGTGESVNISSGGMLFRCGAALPMGDLIEVDLVWPLQLESQQPLELRLYGMILRSNNAGTALAISKYEFRTA